MNNQLSKSLFIRGLQCHKSLYLHKHNPELKDETSEQQEAVFAVGYEIGDFARQLFPGGKEIPYFNGNYNKQLLLTKSEIDKGASTLYEATFSYDDVLIRADIFKSTKHGWDFYEVKSSASVKDYHYNDIAIQYYVINGAGIHINKAYIVYINNQYVRNGDIEPAKLFNVEDVTAEVKKQQKLFQNVFHLYLTDIGSYCGDPFACDFTGHCWSHIPTPSVFDLCGRIDRFGLYEKGIIKFEEIPLEMLTDRQKLQVKCYLDKEMHIDRRSIKEWLDDLSYPLYFLDFETTALVPIPLFDGTRPYQPVPFQYSLHFINKKDGRLNHTEYLAPAGVDPRKELIEKLIKDIPDNACVLAYHKQFEAAQLESFRKWFPQYAKQIDKIIKNLKDLKDPFKNQHCYHWEMNGSNSLKNVLPAFIPEMGYDGMDITEGMMASNAYLQMFYSKNLAEIRKLRKALIEYCTLDTLAMVKLVEKLKDLAKTGHAVKA